MTARALARVVGFAAAAFLPIVLIAQQRDATSPQPVPAGTAEISGRVTSADATPQPLRRVVVTLTGRVANPRSVLTDDEGRFTFARLPAGTFLVTARKAAYLAAPYGARRPGRAGMPIALTDGQRTSIAIAMFRGGAITGLLRDRTGAPVRNVDVRAIDARTLTVPDALPVEITTTDDRGVYRIYGLRPGDYYVAALPLLGGSGEITAPSAASFDAALALLASRRALAPGAAPPPPPPPAQRTIGFAPVFYPGTPSSSDAVSVRVEAGEEKAGIDFDVRPLSMAAIDGVVRGDVPNLAAVQLSIFPSGPRVQTVTSSGSISGRAIDAEGRFRYSNLAPGRYRIVARASRGDSDYLYGVTDIDVRGEDIADIPVVLQSGGTMSGRIAFGGTGTARPPSDLSNIRVTLSLEGAMGGVSSGGVSIGTNLLSSPIRNTRADGSFDVRGIGPGRYTITVSSPTAADGASWKLRSVMVSGRNVLDDVLELGPGVDWRDVTVNFSDELTQLSGTLQGVTGQLITEYYMVVIPADRSMWRPRASRILSVRPATDGRFLFDGLLAGEYILAALTDVDPIDLWDPAFLAQIAAAGVPITIADGEKKVHDLRVR